MYNVSQAYKDAIISTNKDTYVNGTITLVDNTVIPITTDDFVLESLYYTNQCTSDNGFSIGHTHTGEQGITIYDNVTNYRRFHGAKIELTYYLKINETDYEGVPLGIFEVVEATRPTATTIKLVGYDNMTKFDVDYPLNDETTEKTPFQRLKDICVALGVELWDADANVQGFLNLMPNGTTPHTLAFSPEIVTARDYLDYLCQLLCGFATIDRLGRLRIVCWRLKGTITGYSIPDNLRKKSEFNDTVLKYSAVNMSVSFIGGDDVFVKNIIAPETPTGAGEVLSMYSNALIRGTLYNNAQTILDNIADVITNTDPADGTVMQWIPCDIQYTGDPALDLGDWVTYTGYTAGDGIEVPIHRIDWKYRGWQRLETFGDNKKTERENNANRARQEELATIIKSGVGARSIGEHAEIFNDYDNNIASGKYSHAVGRNSIASGDYSIAMGSYATASGAQSVAIGGNGTQATNMNAIAFGGGKASGSDSFAVGYRCESKGMESIAMGGSSVANSSYSIAIGYDNSATGYAAVAMGERSKTTGDRGFAMGYMCEAAGAAVAMGNISKATDWTSIAIGSSNTSSGMSSVTLGGANNKSNKTGATCISGVSNTADGEYSAILGGSNNKTSGTYSAVLGGQNNVSGGMRAVAMGEEVTAKGNNQLAIGKYNVEDTTNQYALVIGGGTSSARKNIFTVDWAGNVETTGTINGSGSGGGGADGKSAYEIAVENGFVGTETEWLESLKGEEGEQGPPGEQGPKGDKGDKGEDGAGVAVVNNLISTSITSALSANQGRQLNNLKVDKVAGKDLSTNDFTNVDKTNVDDWASKKTRFLNGPGTNAVRLNTSSNSASGSHSVAGGYDTGAPGNYSTAFGFACSAALYGFAVGNACKARTNIGAVAMGDQNIASGRGACAVGSETTASGGQSFTANYRTTAIGAYSSAFGNNSTATFTGAFAIGERTNANGMYSFAGGHQTESWQYQTVLGKFNSTAYGQTITSNTSGNPLIIGKGTSTSARANCFRVATSGAVYSTGAYNTTGADYAEYFEWLDGNPNNEDRRGLFVTLDGEKIRIANADDDYILGVISANASVVGDSHEDQWNGMYLYDVYGSPVLEWVEEPAVLDDKGNVIQDAYMVQTQKLNPDYDPSKPYTPRSQRKEWSAVGIMGKLVVRDDGTCQVNGYCSVADGGIATATDIGYRVLARLDDNHIKILIK